MFLLPETPDEVFAVGTRLRRLGMTTREIAKGSGLKPDWIAKMRQNAIADPGVVRLSQLMRWMDGVDRERSMGRMGAGVLGRTG